MKDFRNEVLHDVNKSWWLRSLIEGGSNAPMQQHSLIVTNTYWPRLLYVVKQSGSSVIRTSGAPKFGPTTDMYFPMKLLLQHFIIIIIIIIMLLGTLFPL
jgi:hypothetical protein